jgi:hypothetical protein
MNKPNKLVLHYTGLEGLANYIHSSLLSAFMSYEKMKYNEDDSSYVTAQTSD